MHLHILYRGQRQLLRYEEGVVARLHLRTWRNTANTRAHKSYNMRVNYARVVILSPLIEAILCQNAHDTMIIALCTINAHSIMIYDDSCNTGKDNAGAQVRDQHVLE